MSPSARALGITVATLMGEAVAVAVALAIGGGVGVALGSAWDSGMRPRRWKVPRDRSSDTELARSVIDDHTSLPRPGRG